jgi:signal transduction histidine kinase
LSYRISIRGYRSGFFFVVFLLAGVASFTLWSELRTNARVDRLVTEALARDALIGRIRVAAVQLESTVDSHIQALTDEDRLAADQQMEAVLADIALSTEQYTVGLPAGETEIWSRFNHTSQALGAQVRKAVTYSNRKEAERAKRHLVEKIRPVTATLDGLAETLSQQNAKDTTRLLHDVERLRLRATWLAAIVALGAVIISILVGKKVTSLLSKQEETIAHQLEELGRRNKELDAFASRVAHDLVTPLSPLKGYLRLIRRSNAVRDGKALEMLGVAEASASRMAEMIEALLRFCRAGNRQESAVAPLDVAVSTILMEAAQSAAHHQVRLERDIEPGVSVTCPAQLLQSIAQNVLSNAVKYTAGRPDAKVTVRVRKERGEGVLEVTDNGIGMTDESLRSLFQPFFRAPEVRGLPGHGLGLVTTKRLVEAHGGTVHVQSQRQVGTQLTVRLPLVPADLIRPVAPPLVHPEPSRAPSPLVHPELSRGAGAAAAIDP